jgi:hypothetical protein
MSETPEYLTVAFRRQSTTGLLRRSEYWAYYKRVNFRTKTVFKQFSKAFKTKAAAEEAVLAWRDHPILGEYANPERIQFVDLGWIP